MIPDRIKNKLRHAVLNNELEPQYRTMSYNDMLTRWNNGSVSPWQWNLYQYAWRNSVVRFSDTASAFEHIPLPK